MVVGKTLKKTQHRVHTARLKKRRNKNVTQKAIKNFLLKNDTDYEKYGEMLTHFKLFFKAIIDIDNKDYNAVAREKYDVKKDKVLDKLHDIEYREPIIKRIKKTSPDIYETIGITNDTIPYLELIDVYYKILQRLDDVLEGENDASLRSEASMVQADILDELVNVFMKKNKKKNMNVIDDGLLDMFRGMALKSDVNELEDLFRMMKVEL